MTELKTKATEASVKDYIAKVSDDNKRKDALTLLALFEETTGMKPKMWGSSIVGFGSYHYKSERSAQEGDWFLTGFSVRKQNLTLYILSGFSGEEVFLKKLGKHKRSVGCLYINSLEDVHMNALKQIIKKSFLAMKKNHGVK